MRYPVICGVATIKNRVENLKITVNSVIDQIDRLIVYQNGYDEIFDFLQNPKIKVISSLNTGIDMGDAGKFYEISKYDNCYYFTIDDDLIYPKNYILNLIKYLRRYKNQVIVSHHGRIMKDSPKSYYKDVLMSYRCLDDIESVTKVHFGGTGVMGLHTGFVKNLNFNHFKIPNMADIWMGVFAEDNNIPILVLPHKKGWIKTSLDLKSTETLFHKFKDNHDIQNKLIQNMKITTIN